MRQLLFHIAAVVFVAFLPAMAWANVGEPAAGGSGSPEPLAALLLAAGAIPTYGLYRRARRRRREERS